MAVLYLHQIGSCRAIARYSSELSIVASSARRKSVGTSAITSFEDLSDSSRSLSFSETAQIPSECVLRGQQRRSETDLKLSHSLTVGPRPRNHPGVSFSSTPKSNIYRCHAIQWRSNSTNRLFCPRQRCILISSSIALSRGVGWSKYGGIVNQETRRTEIVCKASGARSIVGSPEWLSKASPYDVLGVSANSSDEDIKAAFRAKIKEYHPDVYKGLGDADAITQRLLRAYELLIGNDQQTTFKREVFDPFEEPECMAEELFVNELACIGRGCPYPCVERAPDVFQFASDTGRAHAVNQGKGGEYHVQLAVGQCPNNCIHYLTPAQRLRLEEILKSVLEGIVYSSEVVIMDGLIARANFENGRYQSPRRQANKSEQWVDWY